MEIFHSMCSGINSKINSEAIFLLKTFVERGEKGRNQINTGFEWEQRLAGVGAKAFVPHVAIYYSAFRFYN